MKEEKDKIAGGDIKLHLENGQCIEYEFVVENREPKGTFFINGKIHIASDDLINVVEAVEEFARKVTSNL